MKEINMRILLSVSLSISVSLSAFAAYETPLTRSPFLSEVEFRAFLLSEPDYKAASLEILKNRPIKESAQLVRERYEAAERAFISADVINSHQTYLEVSEMAMSDDWSAAQRAMIFHSFLRAAQTASTLETRRELLQKAVRFSANEKIDKKLFPPPLVEEFDFIKSQEQMTPVVLPKSFKSYSYAILNGEVSELKSYMLRVPAGEFRLTLISDHLAPVTRVMSANELKSWQPKSDSLVAGGCDTAQFHSQLPANSAALFQGDCVARKNQMPNAPPTLLEQTLQNRDPYLNMKANSSPAFYKNKWFWGAMGVIAVAVAIDQNRDRERSSQPEPTVKDGF
jgi:hypothetical protein